LAAQLIRGYERVFGKSSNHGIIPQNGIVRGKSLELSGC